MTRSAASSRATKDSSQNRRGRVLCWLIGTTALLVAIAVLGSYFYHHRQLQSIAAGHLRLVVAGPSALHAGAPAEYQITTTTVTGNPLPAQIELALYGPDDKRLLAQREMTDDDGRMAATIPADMAYPAQGSPAAQLKVVATQGAHREEFKLALPIHRMRFVTRLSLDAAEYRPGDTIRYCSLSLLPFGMKSDRSLPVEFSVLDPSGAVVPGSKIEGLTSDGVGQGSLVLPRELAGGICTLVVRSLDGSFDPQRQAFPVVDPARPQSAAKPKPNPPDAVEVKFFPEGGSLVEGVENRVYLTSRLPSGQPVAIAATVASRQGAYSVETSAAGRGSFVIVPTKGETYRMKIATPAGVAGEPHLPQATTEKVALSVGNGVFAAGAPIEFMLRALEPDVPLVVVATSRGVPVAQKALIARGDREKPGLHSVSLPVDEQIGGAIRLTVFDASASPPRAVAERLVFRRLAHRLNVRAVGLPAGPALGNPVELKLAVEDEAGRPTAATLGVTVVRQAAEDRSGRRTSDLIAWSLLGNDLTATEDLVRAADCLADDKDSASALDMLLATAEPRRAGNGQPTRPATGLTEAKPAAGGLQPPAVYDNLSELRAKYESGLNEYRSQRTRILNTIITLGCFAALAMALAATILGLLGYLVGMRLWLPVLLVSLSVATCLWVVADPSWHRSVDGKAVAMASGDAPSSDGEPEEKATAAAPKEPAGLRPFDEGVYAYRPGSAGSTASTVYWNPRLAAGGDGQAMLRLDLPDPAANYRVLVEAHGGGRVGSAAILLPSQAAGKK